MLTLRNWRHILAGLCVSFSASFVVADVAPTDLTPAPLNEIEEEGGIGGTGITKRSDSLSDEIGKPDLERPELPERPEAPDRPERFDTIERPSFDVDVAPDVIDPPEMPRPEILELPPK